MAITTVITNLPTPPQSTDPANFIARADAFVTALDSMQPELNSAISEINSTEANINEKEALATTAAEASVSAANYQGDWTSKGYTLGQSVTYSGIRWSCKLAHASAQTPSEGTYWTQTFLYYGAIGNVQSPLLYLPLKNDLTMKSGVGSATFTRASTATYIDRYGVLKTAAIDEPRFEKEGYLNEGSSTNLFTYSNAFDHTNWGNASNTLVSGHSAPDGSSTATLSTTVNADSCAIYKSNVTVVGNSHTVSIFAKAGTASSLTIRSVDFDTVVAVQFNLSAKTTNNVIGTIVELANGWFRCSATLTFTGTDIVGDFYIYVATNSGTNYSSNVGNSMYIFGAQLEALPFASSYIPTTSASVTRAADVFSVTLQGNMPNCQNNADGYTVGFDYDTYGAHTANQYLWSIGASSTNNVSGYLTTALSLRSQISNATGNTANSITPSSPKGGRAIQIQSNTILTEYFNGALLDTDANTTGKLGETTNSLTSIKIGGYALLTTSNLYGHISNFRIWNRSLTPQEVALA